MRRLLPISIAIAAAIAVIAVSATASRHRHKHISLPDRPNPDGSVTLPNGWHLTPAGRSLPLPGDLPAQMLFTPDGKYLLISTDGFHDHTVNVLDLASEKIVQSVDVGKDWAGMSLDPTSGAVYISSGGPPSKDFQNEAAQHGATPEILASLSASVQRLAWSDGKLTRLSPLEISGLAEKDRFTAGLATGKDGALYVVNTQNDTVYRLRGTPQTLDGSAQVGYRPYGVAVSPDGQEIAVSNWGDKSVSLLSAARFTEGFRIPVGAHPNALVYAPDGRLFVANAGSNSVSVISNGSVVETIQTALDPKAPVGSTPDALALTPDGKRLFVANADNNDVAVVDISNARESRVLGFIPTGWYPSALAVSPDGRKLYVGVGKGLRFRANVPLQTKDPDQVGPTKFDYIGNVLSGAVSIVDVPDSRQLAAYTRQVLANVPQPNAGVDPQAIRAANNAFRKIKHVLFIIRENRTYDQVFGDMKQGNSDPNLVLFGEQVTPNAHALVSRYVLLDNLYCNGEVSEDGHQWCNAAYATDFTERAWVNTYSDRGEPDSDERLQASPAGYLWDNCARHGLTYRSYGEFAFFKSNPNSPPVFDGDKGLSGHASLLWSQAGGRDPQRAEAFITELHEAEKTGEWPQYMVMSLGEDHTQGLEAGAYTPIAHVASNDQALGKMVEAISHSRFWKETAIFVIEDDAQNGPDHVDAHRTAGLVISPYVKRNTVDSTHYTTASMIHTMELILKLPPMTQYDAAATPLYNSFTDQPLQTAYTDLPARVNLEARNPTTGQGASASAKLDFSGYDRADPDALNAILWHALKPGIPLPAPVHSFQSASL
ncbi:MAG TPA: alkaline phosphatase family protein [Chthonomonadaceae bacterium]|nr:alkaline phosphatase family protein [Chthonomonadaceae bacterium]